MRTKQVPKEPVTGDERPPGVFGWKRLARLHLASPPTPLSSSQGIVQPQPNAQPQPLSVTRSSRRMQATRGSTLPHNASRVLLNHSSITLQCSTIIQLSWASPHHSGVSKGFQETWFCAMTIMNLYWKLLQLQPQPGVPSLQGRAQASFSWAWVI